MARQVGPLVVPSVNSVAGWSDVRDQRPSRSIRQQPRRRSLCERLRSRFRVRTYYGQPLATAARHRLLRSMGPSSQAGSEDSSFRWLCGSAGMSETCFVLVGSASAGGWLKPANRRVCTRGRTRRSASYRALQSIGHGIHEAVPRLQGRWGALDDSAAASADGIGGGTSKRRPYARSTGRSMRTRCPNSGFCLLFSDPARLSRIRVGVRDTSTSLVQVDVNKVGR